MNDNGHSSTTAKPDDAKLKKTNSGKVLKVAKSKSKKAPKTANARIKQPASISAASKSKSKKHNKKKHKNSNESQQSQQSQALSDRDHDHDKGSAVAHSPVGLHKTVTSPVHTSSMMAEEILRETVEKNMTSLDAQAASASVLQAIQSHKHKQNNNSNSNSNSNKKKKKKKKFKHANANSNSNVPHMSPQLQSISARAPQLQSPSNKRHTHVPRRSLTPKVRSQSIKPAAQLTKTRSSTPKEHRTKPSAGIGGDAVFFNQDFVVDRDTQPQQPQPHTQSFEQGTRTRQEFVHAIAQQKLQQQLQRTPVHAMNVSQFRRVNHYHNARNHHAQKPVELTAFLDRIETDLLWIFRDAFLANSNRTKKIYSLTLALHREFLSYNLSFLLPMVRVKLSELDAMFLSVNKFFNRFKRYHRSPQILKYKSKVNKLKNDVDALLLNMQSHTSVVLYGLIRAKQLYVEFHRNSKLLLFWLQLFPSNELEFTQLNWIEFVRSVRDNTSFAQFQQFRAEDMLTVLSQNYEILTIHEFLKYVLEYESVGGWLDDMYAYLAQEIAKPKSQSQSQMMATSPLNEQNLALHDTHHEKDNGDDDDDGHESDSSQDLEEEQDEEDENEDEEVDVNTADTEMVEEKAMDGMSRVRMMSEQDVEKLRQEFMTTSKRVMTDSINTHITPKINELMARFDKLEQTVARIDAQTQTPQLHRETQTPTQTHGQTPMLSSRDRTQTVVVHEDAEMDDEDDDDDDEDANDSDEPHETALMHLDSEDTDDQQQQLHLLRIDRPDLRATESDNNTCILHPSPTPDMNGGGGGALTPSSSVYERTVPHDWSNELQRLKRENAAYKEKLESYESRIARIKSQSKQFFTLQTRLDYHEKLALVIKQRCFSLHKQLSADVSQLTQWHSSQQLLQDVDGVDQQHTLDQKLSQLQHAFNRYFDNDNDNGNNDGNEQQLMHIKQLFSEVQHLSSVIGTKLHVCWNRMHSSLQYGIQEIHGLHAQLKDLCEFKSVHDPTSMNGADGNNRIRLNVIPATANSSTLNGNANGNKLRITTKNRMSMSSRLQHRHSYLYENAAHKKKMKAHQNGHASSSSTNLVLTGLFAAAAKTTKTAKKTAATATAATATTTTDSVSLLKELNNQVLPMTVQVPSRHKKTQQHRRHDRPRTYSANELQQLTFKPMAALKDGNDDDYDTNSGAKHHHLALRLRMHDGDSDGTLSTHSYDAMRRRSAKRVSFNMANTKPLNTRQPVQRRFSHDIVEKINNIDDATVERPDRKGDANNDGDGDDAKLSPDLIERLRQQLLLTADAGPHPQPTLQRRHSIVSADIHRGALSKQSSKTEMNSQLATYKNIDLDLIKSGVFQNRHKRRAEQPQQEDTYDVDSDFSELSMKSQQTRAVAAGMYRITGAAATATAHTQRTRSRATSAATQPPRRLKTRTATMQMRWTPPLNALRVDHQSRAMQQKKQQHQHQRNQTLSIGSHRRRQQQPAPMHQYAQNALHIQVPRPSSHKRYKTASNIGGHRNNMHLNTALLSPHWAATVALKRALSGDRDRDEDGSFSDLVSTLSHMDDYQNALLHMEVDDDDESYEHFVNIDYAYQDLNGEHLHNDDDKENNVMADEDDDDEKHQQQIPLHLRNRSYRFPTQRTKLSIVDPFDLLDDQILEHLTRHNETQQQFKQYEVELKSKLTEMLREVDIEQEGKLDIADFTSAVMNVVDDYDDIMEDAELLFETLENKQDDMGALNIVDIVDAIMLNRDDGAAKNIKQQIMIAFKLNDGDGSGSGDGYDEDGEEDDDEEEEQNFENMPALTVKPKVKDPNEEPYKPVYYFTAGLQKLTPQNVSKKLNETTEEDTSDNVE